MKLSDELVDIILQKIPGAKKAAQGVLIPTEDGMFHLRNVISEKELKGLTDEEMQFYEFCSKKEIIRLRSIKGPHDYLLRLRANAISVAPRAVRVMASRRREYEESGRPWSLTHYYHTKDFHHKSYIKLLEKKNRKRLKNVPSGLACIDEVNALCIKSLAGDVVLVSESLEYFYYFMTIAFYGNLYNVEWIDRVDALIIALRIIKGTEALDFDIDSRGELPDELERAIQSLVQRQMQFTYGHEYAHYLCNHIPSAETMIKLNASASQFNELALYNHSLEYEADYYALKNIEVKKADFGDVTQGAFSVLIYLHFIEKFSSKFGLDNFSVSETHPAAKDRANQLFDNLGKQAPINKNAIDEMFTVADQLSEVLNSRIDYLKDQYDDIFGFYGSLYLPSFKKNSKVDRIDF
ncbi:hypothetical protein DQ400_15825 [Vreelandella sulfidaeris]|uniref:Uncharacterized protein n=1 Tax=Vreelandella sulfidaeris TaxID=115553 RepID=A0A365TK56_9GAMM|nr:hypothetical protein [Halomonas sulfidaeris]RBI65933.1 hypothetical protein DQ400_15825 [Halomonas sulfidaeris]